MTNRSAVATPWCRTAGRVSTLSILALVAAVGTTFGTGAYAQAGTGEPREGVTARKRTDAELVDLIIHYVKIRNYDMVANTATELLERNPSDADIVNIVERDAATRRSFEDAMQIALRNSTSQPFAAKLTGAYERGVMARARNADQIARNIKELGGNLQQQMFAQKRLVEAGEYAMPQLLEAFLNKANPALQPKIQQVFQSMGRQCIIPLCTALLKVGPVDQERIADLLGRLEYPTSLPYLSDVATTTQSEPVRAACTRAMSTLSGGNPLPDTASLYRLLSEAYYNEKSELTSFPGESHQILWDYNPSAGGLLPTAIVSPVYHEAMCMGLAERAMTLETQAGAPHPETIALWVSSNFSREIDTPKDYQNPAYPATRRSPAYYAVASGADVAQRVLARGLDTRDTPLARRALIAVERTAGGKNLFAGGGRMPLLEALNYPNRRVQYEAALALAAAQPQSAFAGSERVVPVLASAIRGASSQYAVVVTGDAETYQGIRRMLAGMGYTVLPQGRTLSDIAQPIAEAPAVDLVVSVGLNAEQVPGLVGEVRASNKLAATPLLAITSPEAYSVLRHRYATDASVAVRPMGTREEQLSATLTDLLSASTGGPISEEEARQYAQRSLAALRDLAVSANPVLNVGDASMPLITALADQSSPDRIKIAEVLSRIGQERTQRAVMEAAMAAKGGDRVVLLGMVADSAKRFGNMLEIRSVAQIVDLATNGSDDEATAAAALMGALNLPNNELVGLIAAKK